MARTVSCDLFFLVWNRWHRTNKVRHWQVDYRRHTSAMMSQKSCWSCKARNHYCLLVWLDEVVLGKQAIETTWRREWAASVADLWSWNFRQSVWVSSEWIIASVEYQITAPQLSKRLSYIASCSLVSSHHSMISVFVMSGGEGWRKGKSLTYTKDEFITLGKILVLYNN